MKLNKQLDEIINILYDEKLFHFKKVSTLDIVIFGGKKYGLKSSDKEILFIISILINDGYVIQNSADWDKMEGPTYSLTTKGVLLKINGGFEKASKIEKSKQLLIQYATIVTIIVGLTTLFEFGYKHLYPKSADMIIGAQVTNNYNTNTKDSNGNKSPIIKIVPSSSVLKKVEKSGIGGR